MNLGNVALLTAHRTSVLRNVAVRVLLAVEEAVSVEPVAEMVLKGIRRPILVHNVTGVAQP